MRSPDRTNDMLPTATNRSHRSGLPATGLGSILVVAPRLAVGPVDRAVVAAGGVAVGADDVPPMSADGRVGSLATIVPVAVGRPRGEETPREAGR